MQDLGGNSIETIMFDKGNKLIEIPTKDLILDLTTVTSDSIKIPKGVISWSKYSSDQLMIKVKRDNFNNFINTTAKRFPSFLKKHIRDIKEYNRVVYGQEELLHYKDRFGFTFEVLLTIRSDGYYLINTKGTTITRKTWDGISVKPIFNNVYSDLHICWGKDTVLPTSNDAFQLAVNCTEYFFSLSMNDDNCYMSANYRFILPKHHIINVLERRVPQIQQYYPNISRRTWDTLLDNISKFLDNNELTPLNYLLIASMFDVDISLFDIKSYN
jgi:hypothetical protein